MQNFMKTTLSLFALTFLIYAVSPAATAAGQAGAQSAYPTMAPLNQYLIPDQNSEIALARSAAPPSISDAAEVMVLGRDGYTTAVHGTNGGDAPPFRNVNSFAILSQSYRTVDKPAERDRC